MKLLNIEISYWIFFYYWRTHVSQLGIDTDILVFISYFYNSGNPITEIKTCERDRCFKTNPVCLFVTQRHLHATSKFAIKSITKLLVVSSLRISHSIDMLLLFVPISTKEIGMVILKVGFHCQFIENVFLLFWRSN